MPPQGACINGVGALPTPYGPTLRGAHNALRASKYKKGEIGHDHMPATRSGIQPSNYGQNLWKLSQYLRLCVHVPILLAKIKLQPKKLVFGQMDKHLVQE